MKNIPDKIYLQIGEENSIKDNVNFEDLVQVTWSTDRIYKSDIVFYRKKTKKKLTNKLKK
jgi:hypothetical protein